MVSFFAEVKIFSFWLKAMDSSQGVFFLHPSLLTLVDKGNGAPKRTFLLQAHTSFVPTPFRETRGPEAKLGATDTGVLYICTCTYLGV